MPVGKLAGDTLSLFGCFLSLLPRQCPSPVRTLCGDQELKKTVPVNVILWFGLLFLEAFIHQPYCVQD